MKFKKNFLMIFVFRLVFFTILVLQVHAENSIEQEVKARGESTQQFVSGSLVSGSAEMTEYAKIFFKTYKKSTKFHPDKNIKRLMIFKKFNKVFFVLDKGSTAYEVYTANKKGDYVGIGEAVINDIGSGLTAFGGITILSAAGFAASPIVLFGGSLVGAFVYNVEGKRLIGLLGDELDDYIGYVENDPLFKTPEYKKKVKKYYLDMCLQIKKEYIKTGIRPSKVYFDTCIKYGIDIYRICPENAEARWSSEKNKIQCHCSKGFKENQAKNKCIPEKDCSKWRGSVAVRDENTHKTVCRCPKGYKWIKVMNQCANHYQVSVYCDQKWSGSIPAWDKKNKKQSCRCPDGTEWNKQLNRCSSNIQEIRGNNIDNNGNNQIDEERMICVGSCVEVAPQPLYDDRYLRCGFRTKEECEIGGYCRWKSEWIKKGLTTSGGWFSYTDCNGKTASY